MIDGTDAQRINKLIPRGGWSRTFWGWCQTGRCCPNYMVHDPPTRHRSTFSLRFVPLKFPTVRHRKEEFSLTESIIEISKTDIYVSEICISVFKNNCEVKAETTLVMIFDFLSASVFFPDQTPATVWSTEWAWRTSGCTALKMTSRTRRQRRGISTSGWQSSWPGLLPFVWCVFGEWTHLGSPPCDDSHAHNGTTVSERLV